MRSRPRKPAWPSLVWNTWASIPSAVERPDAADAEQDLLPEPVLDVAAVEAVGDRPELGVVLLDVGVEEVERHPPDVGPPHPGRQRCAGKIDGDGDALAERHGHAVGIEIGVALLLPALDVEDLPEVPVLVEEADADERDAEIGRRLEMVAGEDTETAGVLGERLGDAELGREVGHHPQRAAAFARLEPARLRQVALQLGVHLVEEAKEPGVGGEGIEALGRDEAEEPDRIVDRRVPLLGVDPAEEVAGLLVPAPPQVHGERLEGGELRRQARADREAAQRLHRR